jgi:hypothetical protein
MHEVTFVGVRASLCLSLRDFIAGNAVEWRPEDQTRLQNKHNILYAVADLTATTRTLFRDEEIVFGR